MSIRRTLVRGGAAFALALTIAGSAVATPSALAAPAEALRNDTPPAPPAGMPQLPAGLPNFSGGIPGAGDFSGGLPNLGAGIPGLGDFSGGMPQLPGGMPGLPGAGDLTGGGMPSPEDMAAMAEIVGIPVNGTPEQIVAGSLRFAAGVVESMPAMMPQP